MGRNSGGVNNYAKAGTTGIAVNSNGRKLTPKQVAKNDRYRNGHKLNAAPRHGKANQSRYLSL